ncbi:MAG TPA: hypothetical protein VGH51_12325 [Candidatus Angelobacter sp.]|jgi:hypothetical protein
MIDGAASTSLLWHRFNATKTRALGGLKLFRATILNNVISCTAPANCTDRDVIEQIAKQATIQIPIESLPSELEQRVHVRGKVCFGFPGKYFDQIARNYDQMQWWVSRNGLNMEATAIVRLSPFDALAGKLMFEARPLRSTTGRLATEEYTRIAAELDMAGFRPQEYLEGKFRKQLADWNQKHPRKAVRTFHDALSATIPDLDLRRAVQKRLHRAESAWKLQLPLSER